MEKQQQDPASVRYNYPFASTAEEDGVRIQNGFDMQEAIDKTKGTILEVGGPTMDGFYFLRNITLPRKPIITNLNSKAGMHDKQIRDICSPFIEQKLDIRSNQLHAQSVGVCMAASMPLVAREPRASNQKAWNQRFKELRQEDDVLRQNPKSVPKTGLRFILLHHARAFMEPAGLLLLEQLREQELKYALALGFALRATTKAHQSHDTTIYGSLVLQQQ